MRIRKHAKLVGGVMCSADLLSPPAARHISCHLNQSPWDAISFPPDSASSPYQVDGDEDSFTANASLSDSIGAVESVASMKISVDGEDKNVNNQPPNHALSTEEDMEKVICCKTDGKAWKCKKETSRGHPLCDHHLAQIRTYNSLAHPLPGRKSVAAPEKAAAPTRRPRLKKSGSNSNLNPNPQEFYYYSGFGPRWGKKRGSNNPVNNNNKVRLQEFEVGAAPSSSSSQIDHDLCDYVEDDYDEEEDEFGKKRGRKPIKARSLKSLM
ncbi:Growth-regulating factor like [Actinidia chinensis var. chinensis]|uniref:Growth-regulating factor like n=1 Tax=Actinidia chinensis var. chinensis TaxID=1590841 RepID=A0A2R6R9P8_ACTCC|nr:Growth-regulating factor like [Actinidia chinensis var. chinensis]